mgnify:FL=1
MWVQRVLRHGNAVAIVIPVAIARALTLRRGDHVVLALDAHTQLIIKKIPPDMAGKLLENGTS